MSDASTNPADDLLRDAAWLRALARTLVGDGERADDAAQDAWVVALERGSTQRAWLAGVLRHVARRQWQSNRARTRLEHAAARSEELPSTIDVVARAQAQRRLVEAVLALEEPYRSTILLRHFDDLSCEEIARLQRVPSSTVRTRLSRGLAGLRRRFAREGGPDWPAFLVPLAASPTTKAVLAMSLAHKVGLAAALVVLLAWILRPSAHETARVVGPPDVERGVNVLAVADARGEAHRVLAMIAATATSGNDDEARARASSSTSLVLRVTWGDDGSPAARVPVDFVAWSARDPFLDTITRTTDDGGLVAIDALPAGRVSAYAVFGGSTTRVITPGERAEIALTIPACGPIHGVVVDEHDSPIADASIVLSNGRRSHPIATTDGNGLFVVRAAEPTSSIGARAPGRAPSAAYVIGGAPSAVHRPMRVVMSGPGATITGVVRDARGEPLADALVVIGDETQQVSTDTNGWRRTRAVESRSRTDRDGRFRSDDEAAGTTTITVRAHGHAPWTRSIDVEIGRTNDIAIDLEAGAIVRGVLRDTTGAALADVLVLHGAYGATTSSQTRTAPDGSFELASLPSGDRLLKADARERGRAKTTLALAAGLVTTWDPVIERAPRVAGRVVDERGAPLAGWSVRAMLDRTIPSAVAHATTDDDGAFVLDLHDGVASIRVHDPIAADPEPAAETRDFRAGDDDLVIRIAHEARATASIAGRVTDRDGAPIAGAACSLWATGSNTGLPEVPDAIDGSFRVAPIRAGSYDLVLRAPDRPERRITPIRVGADEHVDLGALVLDVGGTLVVAYERPADLELENAPWVRVSDAQGNAIASIEFDGEVGRPIALTPGDYVVRTSDAVCRANDVAIRVAAGEEVAVRLRLEAATSRTIVVEAPAGSAAPLTVRLVVRDDTGAVVHDEFVRRIAPDEMLAARVLGLRVGAYTVEASADGGLAGSTSFRVADLARAREVVEIALR